MKRILIVVLMVLAFNSKAQIYLNPGVDTSFMKVKKAVHFFNSYISAFKVRTVPDMSKYWPANELKLRKVPDQAVFAQGDYPLYAQGYKPTIIYIRPTKDYVKIKVQFSMIDDKKNIMTMAVVNYYVAINSENQSYFINPITINLSAWKNRTKRNVTFYYPAYHHFSIKRADSLLHQLEKLETTWELKPINVRYYMADDPDELYKLRGFDYALLMGNVLKPSGISDDTDNQVFCGGLGENYFHEVAHLYLNHLYPKSPLQEGLVAFYAGSMGRSLTWHLKRVNSYLQAHLEVDLTKVDDFWYTDPYTNPGSAIQGMICKLVYEKSGLVGLKRVMSFTNYKDIFEKEFNVNEMNINSFIREQIEKQAVK